MEGVRTSIIGRPRPLSRQRRADPDYTLNCEEPAILPSEPMQPLHAYMRTVRMYGTSRESCRG